MKKRVTADKKTESDKKVGSNKKIGSEKKVGALVSGLNVLRYMVKARSPVGVTQVARDVGISPSTCFNLLRTLVLEGLIDFDVETKNYVISYGLLELTGGLNERDRIVQFLKPQLARIAVAHRVAATLWRRIGEDRVVLVERADAESAVRIHMTVGQRLPIFIGALGRCMAAFSGLSKDEMRRKFDGLRWEDPPEFDEYWDDLEKTRTQGYALDRDHYVRGITTVSAPVFDADSNPILAVSAIGFSGQFSDSAVRVLAQELLEHSKTGTRWLNGTGGS